MSAPFVPAEPATAPRPKPGAEIEVVVDALDARGGALGHSGSERVRLPRARLGARLRARVLRRRRSHLEAWPLEELDAGPHAVVARCAHAGVCGGCSLQEVAYERQLVELRRLVLAALAPWRALGVDVESMLGPVIGADERFAYRNKMDFTFSNRRWVEAHEPPGVAQDFALGLHLAGRHQKVLDISRCEIQFEQGNAILASARALALERGLTGWDLRAHTGLLRHLVLRRSSATGEVLACVVTSGEDPEAAEAYARELARRRPEITTMVWAQTDRMSAVASGTERVLSGTGFIRERLGGLWFRVSAQSFFQVNSAQAQRLVELVRELAGGVVGKRVFDVCCGAGVLGLAVARDARELVGFEIEPSPVADARVNAQANGVAGARFVEGDVRATLAAEALRGGEVDVVLVDPPRAGLHADALEALVGVGARRVVYVSCNAASAARDVGRLIEAGWVLERVEALDLFPHTPHVECVFGLARKGEGGV